MRVLVVAEPMLGLDAGPVGETIASAWQEATGGRDVVNVVTAGSVAAEPLVVTVADPWGRPVPAALVLRDSSAVLDTREVAGPQLRHPDDGPLAASSHGIGELVLAALDAGARDIAVPLDDLVCHDAGAGLVAVLAGRPEATMTDLVAADVAAARARLGAASLVGRYADDGPLLGLNGASATQAGAKAMSPEVSQRAENEIGAFVDRMRRAVPEPRDLLTGSVVRRDRQPGAGAGGGLGHGILLLGGRLEDAAAALAADLRLGDAMSATDLVVCTADLFDWQVLRSSLAAELARLAAPTATPVVLLCARAEAGRREAMALGLSGLSEVIENHRMRRRVIERPAAALHDRVVRIARTWSPTD